MQTSIELGGITLDVVRKDIRNVHLSVHPPSGRVTIAAPQRMNLDTLRLFAIGKLGWIRQQQRDLRGQERESRREYLDRESHYVWGKRYLLKLVEVEAAPAVQLSHSRLALRVRPGADEAARAAVLSGWYRQQLKAAAAPLIATWQPRLKVTVNRVHVQQMKTRWGSANPSARTIRLNTELAKKPVACLEYIVLHEMAHLIEPTHGPRFVALMDRCMPGWRETRKLLNELPARHEHWNY